MTKSERLLFIVNMFRVRKKITLEELAGECEVSRRTIYRDLLSLSSLNIPIYFNNGYRLAREITLPPLNFTQDEQELLGFSLRHSSLARSPHISSKLRNIELKILSALPDGGKGGLGSMLREDRVVGESFSRDEDNIIERFLKGLFQRREIEIFLRKNEQRPQVLKPQALQIKGRKWILSFADPDGGVAKKFDIMAIANLRIIRSKS